MPRRSMPPPAPRSPPLSPTALCAPFCLQSTIGHWGADLANTMSPFYVPPASKTTGAFAGIHGLDLEAMGLPQPEELLRHYFLFRGMPETDPHMDYYLGFYWWKTAVILQGISARFSAGQASNPQAQEIGAMTPQLGMLAYSKLGDVGPKARL